MSQLYDFRYYIEKETVQQAVQNITLRELRSLENVLKIHKQGTETVNIEMFQRGDRMFHQIIAESTRNVFFIECHANIMNMLNLAIEIAVEK